MRTILSLLALTLFAQGNALAQEAFPQVNQAILSNGEIVAKQLSITIRIVDAEIQRLEALVADSRNPETVRIKNGPAEAHFTEAMRKAGFTMDRAANSLFNIETALERADNKNRFSPKFNAVGSMLQRLAGDLGSIPGDVFFEHQVGRRASAGELLGRLKEARYKIGGTAGNLMLLISESAPIELANRIRGLYSNLHDVFQQTKEQMARPVAGIGERMVEDVKRPGTYKPSPQGLHQNFKNHLYEVPHAINLSPSDAWRAENIVMDHLAEEIKTSAESGKLARWARASRR